jgi:hypothetical protein
LKQLGQVCAREKKGTKKDKGECKDLSNNKCCEFFCCKNVKIHNKKSYFSYYQNLEKIRKNEYIYILSSWFSAKEHLEVKACLKNGMFQ